MEFFSETDIECLQKSLSEYGNKSFQDLLDLTHKEQCWLNAEINQLIKD